MAEEQILIRVTGKNESKQALQEAAQSTENLTKKIKDNSGAFREVGLAVSAFGLAISTAFLAVGKTAITESARFEQTTVSFTTMLGSAEKSQALLKDLTDFAVKTPFTLPGIESAAKQLMAMGIEQEKIIPTLKSLGDVSAGLSVPLEQVALAYGQVRAAGRLYGTEARQFIQAGIPIWEEVAKVMQVPVDQVKEIGEESGISFEVVEQAFKNMSGEGGRFNDLMTEQSKTLNGILSNLSDQVTLVGRAIGDVLLPYAKDLAKAISPILEDIKIWVQQNPQLTAGIVAIGTAFGLITTAFGGFLLALPSIITFFESLGVVAGIVFGPEFLAIGATVAVIFGGLIAGVYALYQIWTNNMWGIRDAVVSVWGIIQTEFQRVWEVWGPMFAQAWQSIKDVAVEVLNTITTYLNANMPGWKDQFVKAAQEWIPKVADALVFLAGWVKVNFPIIKQQIVEAMQGAYEWLQKWWTEWGPALTTIWEFLKDAGQVTWAIIRDVVIKNLEDSYTFVQKHFGDIKAIIQDAWLIIKGIYQLSLGGIFDSLKLVLDLITGHWDKVGGDIQQIQNNFWEGLKNIFGGALDALAHIIAIGAEQFLTKFSGPLEDIKGAWRGLIDWFYNNPITQTFNKIEQSIAGGSWANGGVFNNGNVQAFAGGGIVNRPTIFPMANGMGLMGEAGPEAIMPLQRNSRGQLGVMSQGGGITVVVSGNSFYGDDKKFAEKIGDEIINQFKKTYSFNSF